VTPSEGQDPEASAQMVTTPPTHPRGAPQHAPRGPRGASESHRPPVIPEWAGATPARCPSRIAHEDGAVRQCMRTPHPVGTPHEAGDTRWNDGSDQAAGYCSETQHGHRDLVLSVQSGALISVSRCLHCGWIDFDDLRRQGLALIADGEKLGAAHGRRTVAETLRVWARLGDPGADLLAWAADLADCVACLPEPCPVHAPPTVHRLPASLGGDVPCCGLTSADMPGSGRVALTGAHVTCTGPKTEGDAT
jgi:hypothetical protein